MTGIMTRFKTMTVKHGSIGRQKQINENFLTWSFSEHQQRHSKTITAKLKVFSKKSFADVPKTKLNNMALC